MVVPVYFDPKTERPVLWSLGTFRLATVAQLTAEPKSPDSIWPRISAGRVSAPGRRTLCPLG